MATIEPVPMAIKQMFLTQELPRTRRWIVVVLLLSASICLFWFERRESTFETGSSVILSHPPGQYDSDLYLSLDAPVTGTRILFTRDGRVPLPTTSSTFLQQPIHLGTQEMQVVPIRTRVQRPDGQLSPVTNASYFLGSFDIPIPVLSLIIDPGDLWDLGNGIYTHPEERGRSWERNSHVTFMETDGSIGFEADAGLRIHGGASRRYPKKSFRLYFREEYGVDQLAYALFPESEVQRFESLVLNAGGQDSFGLAPNWTLMRNKLASDT